MIVVAIGGSTWGWKGGRGVEGGIEHVNDISFWSIGFYLYITRKKMIFYFTIYIFTN